LKGGQLYGRRSRRERLHKALLGGTETGRIDPVPDVIPHEPGNLKLFESRSEREGKGDATTNQGNQKALHFKPRRLSQTPAGLPKAPLYYRPAEGRAEPPSLWRSTRVFPGRAGVIGRTLEVGKGGGTALVGGDG